MTTITDEEYKRVLKMLETEGDESTDEEEKNKYIIMPEEEYKKLVGEVYWVELDSNKVVRFERTKDYVIAQELTYISEDLYDYTVCCFSADLIAIDLDRDNLSLAFEKDSLERLSQREALTAFRTKRVDISQEAINQLARDKTRRDILVDVITVRELLQEQSEAKRDTQKVGKASISLK